jgi:hypothetical protein
VLEADFEVDVIVTLPDEGLLEVEETPVVEDFLLVVDVIKVVFALLTAAAGVHWAYPRRQTSALVLTSCLEGVEIARKVILTRVLCAATGASYTNRRSRPTDTTAWEYS